LTAREYAKRRKTTSGYAAGVGGVNNCQQIARPSVRWTSRMIGTREVYLVFGPDEGTAIADAIVDVVEAAQ
jgi:hypothetical protein